MDDPRRASRPTAPCASRCGRRAPPSTPRSATRAAPRATASTAPSAARSCSTRLSRVMASRCLQPNGWFRNAAADGSRGRSLSRRRANRIAYESIARNREPHFGTDRVASTKFSLTNKHARFGRDRPTSHLAVFQGALIPPRATLASSPFRKRTDHFKRRPPPARARNRSLARRSARPPPPWPRVRRRHGARRADRAALKPAEQHEWLVLLRVCPRAVRAARLLRQRDSDLDALSHEPGRAAVSRVSRPRARIHSASRSLESLLVVARGPRAVVPPIVTKKLVALRGYGCDLRI